MSTTTAQPFLRWLLSILLGVVQGVRKHIGTLYALTLVYALGVQAGAPEWAANTIVMTLAVGTATNVGEWAFKRRAASTPTSAAGGSPIPASPTPAAGAGASAP